MKIFWKTVGIASAVAAAATIITGTVCKCTERAKKTFKKDSEKETKKESK